MQEQKQYLDEQVTQAQRDGDVIATQFWKTYRAAVNAERNGADRIELCKNLVLDGLTPEINVIQKTMWELNIEYMGCR